MIFNRQYGVYREAIPPIELLAVEPRKTVRLVSFLDPKSTEDLRKLAQTAKDGGHLSDNDKWELERAKSAGVKDIEPK